MGEKVYVHAKEARPVSPDPLQYASPDVPPRWWVRFIGESRRMYQQVVKAIEFLGGRYQVIFALGLGIAVAALTMAVATPYMSGQCGFFAFAGTFLVGVVIRVPLRKH